MLITPSSPFFDTPGTSCHKISTSRVHQWSTGYFRSTGTLTFSQGVNNVLYYTSLRGKINYDPRPCWKSALLAEAGGSALKMPPREIEIECTAYCSCGYCCNWEWGVKLPSSYYLGLSPSWMPLRLRTRKQGSVVMDKQLPVLARYWTVERLTGYPYYGLTSNGRVPAQARPPILSKLSVQHIRQLPARLLLFPWLLLPRHGSIAADTDFYPFGTKMYVPGYGWGEVEDRGGAIKGKVRIDLYHRSHHDALKWGRQKLKVLVILPGEHPVDRLNLPGPVKSVLHGLNWFRGLLF